MKYVRIENGIVAEIIPAAATVPSVEYWYGAAFAAECVEAADEVEQGWSYGGAGGGDPGRESGIAGRNEHGGHSHNRHRG